MSTKTTFKRIALVAAASLGLGVLSVVPAQSAPLGVTITPGSAGATSLLTSTTVSSDSTTGVNFTVQGLLTATGDSISVTFVKKSEPTGSTVAARMLYIDTVGSTVARVATDADKLVGTNATRLAAADSLTAGNSFWINASTANNYAGGTFNISLESATATAKVGTYTYTILATPYTGATAGTQVTADVSIVVSNSTALSTTASSLKSFEMLKSSSQSAGATKAADDLISAEATADSTNKGFLFIGNRNSTDASTLANDSITVTVTGAGVVCSTTVGSVNTTVGTCGKTLSKVSVTGGDYQFLIRGDGNAGSSTIVTTAAVAGYTTTSTMTFYAKAPKTITATLATPLLKVGANDSAISVTAVDAGGNAWTGTPYIYASAAADATAVGGSATAPTACVLNTAKTLAWCPITATAAGTGSFVVRDASTVALSTATSNAITVTSISGTAASVKLAFDKASYAPGERAVITVTPLDSAGKNLQDGTYTNLLASGGITSNVSFMVNGTSSGNTTNGYSNSDLAAVVSPVTSAVSGTDKTAGSASYVVFMPLSGASTVTISAVGGTSLPAASQVKVSASATVNSDGAAALAAVTALASQVSAFITKINAQITTLTDLVMKIQKKVKA